METPLLYRIERFLSESGMAPSLFGRQSVRDPRLVSDLRNGREPGVRLSQRVEHYMNEWREENANALALHADSSCEQREGLRRYGDHSTGRAHGNGENRPNRPNRSDIYPYRFQNRQNRGYYRSVSSW